MHNLFYERGKEIHLIRNIQFVKVRAVPRGYRVRVIKLHMGDTGVRNLSEKIPTGSKQESFTNGS